MTNHHTDGGSSKKSVQSFMLNDFEVSWDKCVEELHRSDCNDQVAEMLGTSLATKMEGEGSQRKGREYLYY